MIVQPLLILLGLAVDPEPMDAGWFERFGFAAGLLVAVLVGLYRLARLAITKAGDEISEWFKEQTACTREVRRAVPVTQEALIEGSKALVTLAQQTAELAEKLSRTDVTTENALRRGQPKKGEAT